MKGAVYWFFHFIEWFKADALVIIALFVKRFKSFLTEVPILLKTVHSRTNQWLVFYMIKTSVMNELRELLWEGLTEKSWKYINQVSLKLHLCSSFASRRLRVGCCTQDTGQCSFHRTLQSSYVMRGSHRQI